MGTLGLYSSMWMLFVQFGLSLTCELGCSSMMSTVGIWLRSLAEGS